MSNDGNDMENVRRRIGARFFLEKLLFFLFSNYKQIYAVYFNILPRLLASDVRVYH